MEALTGYLMKVSIIQVVFYLLYFFLFRNTSFFNLNRFYLLFTLVFSFIIPSIVLPIDSGGNHDALEILSISQGNFIETDAITTSSPGREAAFQISPGMVIATVYLSVVFLLFTRCVWAVNKILQLKRTGNSVISDKVTIIHINGVEPFSFLNMVFVDPTKTSAAILLHEKAHVKYYHWIDVLVIEFAGIICWFNPVTWFYKSAVKQQHEYLADEYVVSNGIQTPDYLDSILRFISIEEPIGPVNKFNTKSLKKRIVMMTKNKSSLVSRLFYLAAIPVVCIVLFSFSKKENRTKLQSMRKETVVVIDAAHGGADRGSLSSSGLTEKDLTLSIASLVQKIGKSKGLHVVLTRSGDETVSLNDRVTFAQKSNADVFVSLHFAFDQKSELSGIECFVSEENARFSESKNVSSILMAELKKLKGVSVNNVKSSSAFVLKKNTVPAVILELGYLSNENDVMFISDEKNHEVLAKIIVESLSKID